MALENYKALTIAGSDTSGGAGMEADLKTFEEMGVYGMVALTVIVAQNPKDWAHDIFPIDLPTIERQIATVGEGIGINAMKTGMLGSAALVELVAKSIDKYNFKNVEVELIKTSHDASPSCGFIFTFKNGEKLGFITDSGYLTFNSLERLKNLEYYYFESNYDVSLLVSSSRSDALKSRILSSKGHLSNEQASIYLSYLIGENTKSIMLAHLSEECNSKFLALNTLFQFFNENNIKYDKYDIKCASQNEVTIL